MLSLCQHAKPTYNRTIKRFRKKKDSEMDAVKLSRQVIIEADESGGYVVSCPSLPGCYSQGETIDEALANIREAIELYIEVLEEDGKPIPADNLDRLLCVV
jgi:predicted RNase H-like HicB family nuclease